MKTAKEWFSLLPNKYKGKAIEYSNKEGNLNTIYPTLYDALLFAFKWDRYAESENYWNKAHNWIADKYGTTPNQK